MHSRAVWWRACFLCTGILERLSIVQCRFCRCIQRKSLAREWQHRKRQGHDYRWALTNSIYIPFQLNIHTFRILQAPNRFRAGTFLSSAQTYQPWLTPSLALPFLSRIPLTSSRPDSICDSRHGSIQSTIHAPRRNPDKPVTTVCLLT